MFVWTVITASLNLWSLIAMRVGYGQGSLCISARWFDLPRGRRSISDYPVNADHDGQGFLKHALYFGHWKHPTTWFKHVSERQGFPLLLSHKLGPLAERIWEECTCVLLPSTPKILYEGSWELAVAKLTTKRTTLPNHCQTLLYSLRLVILKILQAKSSLASLFIPCGSYVMAVLYLKIKYK